MYPLKRKKYAKFRRFRIRKTHVIGAIWLLGIAISMPEYLMFRTHPFCYNRQLYFDCRADWPESTSDEYTVFIFMATFLVPLSLLSYLYTSIGLKLWRRQCPGNVDVNRDLTMQTRRVKCIKMLLVVVVLFAVFWLPLQTFSMVTFLYPEIRRDFEYQSLGYTIFIGTYFACHWLSMAHSCLNPLIYCFMNEKFRSDLNALICGLASGSGTERRYLFSPTNTAAAAAAAAAAASAAASASATGAAGAAGGTTTSLIMGNKLINHLDGSIQQSNHQHSLSSLTAQAKRHFLQRSVSLFSSSSSSRSASQHLASLKLKSSPTSACNGTNKLDSTTTTKQQEVLGDSSNPSQRVGADDDPQCRGQLERLASGSQLKFARCQVETLAEEDEEQHQQHHQQRLAPSRSSTSSTSSSSSLEPAEV